MVTSILERLAAAGATPRRGGHGRRVLRAAADAPARGRRRAARRARRGAARRHRAGAGRPLRRDAQLQDEDVRAARRARPRDAQGLRLPIARARAVPAPAHRGAGAAAAARAAAPRRKAVVDRWLDDFAQHRVPVRHVRAHGDPAGADRGVSRAASSGRRRRPRTRSPPRRAGTWAPGDQISYYVVGRTAGVTVHEYARLAAEWTCRSSRRERGVLPVEGAGHLGSLPPVRRTSRTPSVHGGRGTRSDAAQPF